jgi:hypothetical protein
VSGAGADGPELWGGVECTVNRVHDQYFDQMRRSGHRYRLEDLDAFAALGFRALRYPVCRSTRVAISPGTWWPGAGPSSALARVQAAGSYSDEPSCAG